MYSVKLILFCNLKQASEWLWYHWEPLQQEDDDYLSITGERVRTTEDDEKCRVMPVILLAALQQGVIHLYRIGTNRAVQEIGLDDKNDHNESLRDFIERRQPSGISEKIQLLEEITNHWFNREPLLFSTSELQREWKKGISLFKISPSRRFEFRGKSLYLIVSDQEILLKNFRVGVQYNIIKNMIASPGRTLEEKEAIEVEQSEQRLDNLIYKFKQTAKQAIDAAGGYFIQEDTKTELKELIEKSFNYTDKTCIFNPDS